MHSFPSCVPTTCSRVPAHFPIQSVFSLSKPHSVTIPLRLSLHNTTTQSTRTSGDGLDPSINGGLRHVGRNWNITAFPFLRCGATHGRNHDNETMFRRLFVEIVESQYLLEVTTGEDTSTKESWCSSSPKGVLKVTAAMLEGAVSSRS